MVRILTVILCLAASARADSPEVHAPQANPQTPLVATVPIDQTASSDAQANDPPASPPPAAAEQQTQASKPPAPRELPATESLPLGQAAPGADADQPDAASPQGGSILQSPAVRTGGALTLVLSLIFGLRGVVQAAARRSGGGLTSALGPGGRAPSGVMSVLGRYPVGKGATLVLLQLDRRVLLLSQTGTGFSTLCELTDPDDVASIVRKTADDEGSSLSKKFSSMLRRFESDPAMSDEGDWPVTPRRAMALRDYEATLVPEQRAIAASPGNADSFTKLQSRLDRLRGGNA